MSRPDRSHPGMPPALPKPRVVRLPNGLKVLLCERRNLPLVSLWCWYRVGSVDERPGITGIAHWVEHMNFKGTRRISKEEILRRIELAGGAWNGYTWLDVTTYLETFQSSALEEMLRLEASRMTECLYAPAEVERERTVVISEMQGSENDPRSYLEREVNGTALQAHPYRWSTIGYLSDLRAITRDDLQRFYRAHYLPNNAVLVLVGDFRAADALKLVRRHFGRIARGPDPPAVRTIEPAQTGERRVRLRHPSGADYLQVAYHAPAAADTDLAPMLVLDGILAGPPSINIWCSRHGAGIGKASRLYRALVQSGLASDASSSLYATRHPYLYSLHATAVRGVSPDRLEEALLAEVDRLGRGEIDDADLLRARNQFFTRYALESDGHGDLAHQIGFFETIGCLPVLYDLPRRVAAVTADDVIRVARARLHERRRTIGRLEPEGDAS